MFQWGALRPRDADQRRAHKQTVRVALEVFNAAMAPLRTGADDGTLGSIASRSLTVASYLAERAVADGEVLAVALLAEGFEAGLFAQRETLAARLGAGGAGVVALLEQCSLLSQLEEHAAALWDKSADDDDDDAEGLREAQAENRRQLIISMASDFRAIRCSSRAASPRSPTPSGARRRARRPRARPRAARRERRAPRLARDALAVHAPLARRLGMHHFVAELEQFAFKALHPEAHAAISAALSDPERAERHEAVLAETTRVLRRTLHEDDEIVAGIADLSVVGRKKTARCGARCRSGSCRSSGSTTCSTPLRCASCSRPSRPMSGTAPTTRAPTTRRAKRPARSAARSATARSSSCTARGRTRACA